jgi:hypothetical protein
MNTDKNKGLYFLFILGIILYIFRCILCLIIYKRLSINGRSTVFQTDDVDSSSTNRNVIIKGISLMVEQPFYTR